MIFFIRTAALIPIFVLLAAACGQKGPLFLPKDSPEEQTVKKPVPKKALPEPVVDDMPDYPAPAN